MDVLVQKLNLTNPLILIKFYNKWFTIIFDYTVLATEHRNGVFVNLKVILP